MNNKNILEYRQKLNEVIIEKRQELEHRQNRLNNNIFAGTCHKSILAQRKIRGVNKVEALIRRKYPLKYDASSDRKT